tara:strand:- start:1740 stop:3230 length:1491 start_codon:yes stop_codon:yes gene_type:complete
LVFLSFSSKAIDCTTDTIGLCTSGVNEVIVETITEEVIHEADGITTITTTTHDITTTTIINENSGDLLDGDNDYVTSKYEGDMDIDWGGQGPASMPSGNNCGQLGTDKCAMITGSGNSTSTMGVSGMGTTFIQTVDISDLNITHGGETNYTIKVDKQDASDSIYMHITGKDGSTNVFSGTDVLSASGTASGYQSYEGGFDFSGSLTTVIIEIGGRDIGLSIGPMFDSVSINVLYNVINTIITQEITTVEMFIALNIDAPEEIINVVEDIFDSNEMVNTDEGMTMEPIEMEDINYDSVEIEMAEIELEIELPEIEIEVAELEMEIETEIETEIENTLEETIEEMPEPEVTVKKETNEPEEIKETESDSEATEKSSVEDESNTEQEDIQQEEAEEQDNEVEKKEESAKEKAGKKIVKSMGDKKRYDATNQLKTLIVMQVLGNSKSFFNNQKLIDDREGFFNDAVLADSTINYNLKGQYLLFFGSEGLHNEMVESQWQN